MKQCIQCDRDYPDSENFCEMDGAYLLPVEEGDELPPGVPGVHGTFTRNRYRRRDDYALRVVP
jgi:hypothetical protein